MSFIISDKQHLATAVKRSKYVPFRIAPENEDKLEMEVNFGHPLYTSISDVFSIRCKDTDKKVVFPVLPDGCISLAFFGDGDITSAKLCGTIDEVRKIEMKRGDKLIVARFLPGTGFSFLHCNANELTNKVFDLKDFINNCDQILVAVNKDISFHDKALLISKLIRVRMAEDDASYLIRYCTDKIFEEKGNIKVADLALETGFSVRYLGKVFEKYIGIPPKVYCEIMRLQASLEILFNEEKQGLLMDVALDSGYFDHAHMNRCYRRFIHCPAGVLRRKGFGYLDFDQIDSYIDSEGK